MFLKFAKKIFGSANDRFINKLQQQVHSINKLEKEYEKLACELAKNPKHLKEIKNKLKKNRLTKPLFDTKLYAKNIESAYTKIYERYCSILPAKNIEI